MDWIQNFIERGQYHAPQNTDIVRNKLLEFLSTNAYWICMFLGIGGILAYLCGYKKGGKVTKFSLVIYWVVAAICSK
ncbi:DUF2878 family protein [Clostridium sporogenes]|uniref:DUF2878 family protein n=1 Tax=Clostridium sporogenes TaxID=1509 RepID=UPI00223749D0|nr:DUF2878 family protein [Clostridium sporogenes]MCW6088791.1 DUF2878 family protein [Clostridium sporogenes]